MFDASGFVPLEAALAVAVTAGWRYVLKDERLTLRRSTAAVDLPLVRRRLNGTRQAVESCILHQAARTRLDGQKPSLLVIELERPSPALLGDSLRLLEHLGLDQPFVLVGEGPRCFVHLPSAAITSWVLLQQPAIERSVEYRSSFTAANRLVFKALLYGSPGAARSWSGMSIAAWPNATALAKDLGLTVPTVTRALAAFRLRGWLRWARGSDVSWTGLAEALQDWVARARVERRELVPAMPAQQLSAGHQALLTWLRQRSLPGLAVTGAHALREHGCSDIGDLREPVIVRLDSDSTAALHTHGLVPCPLAQARLLVVPSQRSDLVPSLRRRGLPIVDYLQAAMDVAADPLSADLAHRATAEMLLATGGASAPTAPTLPQPSAARPG